MNRETKLKEEIRLREGELEQLRAKLDFVRLGDWREKEGKYWLVETFPVNGKTSFSIYHITKVSLNEITYEYVDMENKYIAGHTFNFLIEPFCMKWTEVTKKQFDKECSKIEKKNDLRIKQSLEVKNE